MKLVPTQKARQKRLKTKKEKTFVLLFWSFLLNYIDFGCLFSFFDLQLAPLSATLFFSSLFLPPMFTLSPLFPSYNVIFLNFLLSYATPLPFIFPTPLSTSPDYSLSFTTFPSFLFSLHRPSNISPTHPFLHHSHRPISAFPGLYIH